MSSSPLMTRAMRTAAFTRSSLPVRIPRRSFQSTRRLLQEQQSSPLPPKKPLGAFRGGLIGFLLGAVSAGGGMYYYVMEEYRVSNELLTEDIYNLQATVQRVESYVRTLEDKVAEMSKKK